MKLICLTYAGGNRYSYRNLQSRIDKSIDFITLELPGRGGRLAEPLVGDLDQLVDDLYDQIQVHILSDYMIYGHSMGGMLGDLLLHKLNDNLKPLPFYFLVTGCASPKKRQDRRKLHHLSDADFQVALKQLGGMPDEVMNNQELLEFVMPILRSDIKAIETKVHEQRTKYDVPLLVISGSHEGLAEADVLEWQNETSASFKHLFLNGGHFFIHDHVKYIADVINLQLMKRLKTLQDLTV